MQSRGDELAARRARALVERSHAPALSRHLAALQRADGGFADASGEIAATRRALAALAQVGVVQGAVVEGAVRFLTRAQRPDGCWDGAAEGFEDAAIEATGRTAGALARTRCARASTLDAAADWLAERFAPERVQGFARGPLAAYAATFANVAHDACDGILQWCGRELERGFRTGAFGAVRTARVLVDCDAPALPGARLGAAEVVAALLREQDPNGAFAPPVEPDACRVARTLDALAGLARLGVHQ